MKILDKIAGTLGYKPAAPAEKKAAKKRDPAWAFAHLNLQDPDLKNPYSQHAWVYACVKRIAQNIAGVPFRLFTGDEDSPKPVVSGPLYDIFERPNNLWTKYHLWESIVSLLSLGGNAVWVMDRQRETREPREIWTYPHSMFKPKLVGNTVTSYEFRKNSNSKMVLKPYQVLPFRYYSKDTSFWGQAPLEAARQAAEQDHMASQFNRAFYEHGANPGGVISFKQGLTDLQRQRYRDVFEARHRGHDNAFKTMMLEGDVNYTQLELKHKDMQFLEQKKWSREEVCACFGVPKAEIQVYEDINYATALSADRSFWQKTLIPIMRLIESTLKAQFFMPYDGGRTWGRFDIESISALQHDMDKQVTRAEKLFKMGVPFNRINERLDLGFEEVEGGDTGYLPVNLIPAGTEPPSKAPNKAPEGEKAAQPYIHTTGKEKQLHTEKQAEYWKNFVRVNKGAERDFKSAMRKYVGEVKAWADRVIGRYKSPRDIPESALDVEAKFNDKLKDMSEKNYNKIVAGYAPTVEDNLAAAGYGYKFNVSDPRIVGYIEAKVNKIVQINETLRKQIKGTIEDSLIEGQTIGELQNGISNVMGDTRARSLRIARTETASAANGVEYVACKQAGVKEKMWIASLDEVTRDSHIGAMQQGNIHINHTFYNGLMFPGEPSAPAGEIVNCRCTLMATG